MSKSKQNASNKDAEVAPGNNAGFTVPETPVDILIPLAVGDRVKLKTSVGPIMIVESISADAATCIWFDNNTLTRAAIRNQSKTLERFG